MKRSLQALCLLKPSNFSIHKIQSFFNFMCDNRYIWVEVLINTFTIIVNNLIRED
jgi:hypothetical protein